LPERYSISVPPVTNNIYRSAVPAPKYLPERRSAAFRHHYSPGLWEQRQIQDLPKGGSRRARGARAYNGDWGRAPAGSETEPLVGGQGQSSLKLKAFRLFSYKKGPKL